MVGSSALFEKDSETSIKKTNLEVEERDVIDSLLNNPKFCLWNLITLKCGFIKLP